MAADLNFLLARQARELWTAYYAKLDALIEAQLPANYDIKDVKCENGMFYYKDIPFLILYGDKMATEDYRIKITQNYALILHEAWE